MSTSMRRHALCLRCFLGMLSAERLRGPLGLHSLGPWWKRDHASVRSPCSVNRIAGQNRARSCTG
jgi:hypothetical protein